MPLLQIFTSTPQSAIPPTFTRNCAIALSGVLSNKPLEQIAVHIVGDQQFFIGWNVEAPETTPFAYAILRSIGSLSLEENRQTVAVLTNVLHEQLGIPRESKILIFFNDCKPDQVGMAGRMITDVIAAKTKDLD